MARSPRTTKTKKRGRYTDTKRLQQGRDRWQQADEADTNQLTREQEDLAFYADDQWPTDLKLLREAKKAQGGLPAVPARPTLVINKVKEPVRQVQNQVRSSDFGLTIAAAEDFGDLDIVPDDTEIKLREGLIRKIQRSSNAQAARQWAADRAFIAGRGYYMIMTRFLPGKTWDQEIYVRKIFNQAGVRLDPTHEASDGSDCEWQFVGTWMSYDKYQSLHPKLADGRPNPTASYSDTEFIGMSEEFPDWFKTDGDDRTVRVVDYFYKEHTYSNIVLLEGGQVYDDGAEPTDATIVDRRMITTTTIQWCKIGCGVQELEETEWPGPDMPIIKVVGEELQPYDNERRTIGMVRPARDAQMGFNYMVSKWVEQVGLTPIPPLQLDPDAIDGYEDWYKVLHLRTLPYAPYRSYDDDGRELAPPHRLPVDPNLLPMAQSVAMFDQAIKSTTAVPDPTLGNVDPALKSARAINAVVQNAHGSTSNFVDNLTLSMRYEGQIINNLLYPIYGQRPGRLVRAMTGTNESDNYVIGDQSDLTPQLKQRAAKVAKLTKDAHFNAIIKVTRDYDSRRDEEAANIGKVIEADPTQMAIVGDLFFKNQDGPGHDEMAERYRVMLAPPIQKMLAAKAAGTVFDPVAHAQIAHMEQQLEAAKHIMADLQQKADGKLLDAQTKKDIEGMKLQAEVRFREIDANLTMRMQEMKDATSLEVARINAETKGIISEQTAAEERIALNQTQAHEAAMAEADRAHERESQAHSQAHDAAMATTESPEPEPEAPAEPAAPA